MIPQIGATSTYTTSSTEQPESLGQDVFLNLLITQLKHQDPLEPMEGTEFVTQLAQFSELDEMRELTSGQEDLQSYMASLNNFAAVSLLGKAVEFPGDEVTHQEGTSTALEFLLPSDAAQVTVALYDTQGNLVHTVDKGPMAAGNQTAIWNGTDEHGQPLPSGTYRLDVVARDASQGTIPVELTQQGSVREVVFQDGLPMLRVGERWLSLPDIKSIQTGSAG
jgi:flagellar basal-body rod modification protein FlgD